MCVPIFFYGLGKAGLGDPDEGRNAEAAREMLETGDWITPHLDGVRYLDKPPAYFWTVALSYRLLGVSELSARAPSALFALAAIGLVFWFGRRFLGDRAARFAAVALALSPLYIVFGRIVIFDMMLTFCMTVSTLMAFEAMEGDARRLPAALLFVSAGLGTITKGPVALAAPLLVAVAWALLRRRPGMLKRLGWIQGLVLYAAVVVPWLVLVESRNPGYVRYAVIGENLERMTSNRFETSRPFWFYAKVILPGLFPWILYAGAAAARRARSWRTALAGLAAETDRGRLATAFSGAWLGVLVLFFSLIASKRPSYMLPCAVPLALLVGRLWSRALPAGRARPAERDPSPPGGPADAAVDARRVLALGALCTAIVCALGAVAAILAGPAGMAQGISRGKYDLLLSRRPLFMLTAAGLALAAALLLALRRRRPVALFAASALAIVAVVPLARVASGYLDTVRSSRPVSRFLEQRLKPDDLVICYEQYRPGLNFYLRRPVLLVTSGTPFSSWWVMRHLEEYRRDPSFRMIDLDRMRTLLAQPGPEVYILSPPRMFGRLRRDAGEALDPEPIYEDQGGGLFVRAASSGTP